MAKKFLPRREDYRNLQDDSEMQNEMENAIRNLVDSLILLRDLYYDHGDHVGRYNHKLEKTLKTQATMDWGIDDTPALLY